MVDHHPEDRDHCVAIAAHVGPEATPGLLNTTAWLYSAMVRRGADLPTTRIEANDDCLGGLEERLRRGKAGEKTIVQIGDYLNICACGGEQGGEMDH